MSSKKIYEKMLREYPDSLTVKDLQEMLKIGKNHAYQLINDNEIAHTKIGKRFIIPKTSVIEFLTRNHTSTSPAKKC